jgi:predicted nucleic acid-binding Zn ribbon protein
MIKRSWDGWERERARKRAHRDGAGHSGKIVPLAKAVEEWVDQHRAVEKLGEVEVFSRWAELVGEAVAQQTEPIRLEKGRLVVRVKTSTWRHQLLFMRRELIASLNGRIGQKVIKEIVFTG